MAACAVFSHPLSVDTRVQANAGLFLHRCATPKPLRAQSATLTREARSFPTMLSRSVVSSTVQEYLKSLNFMTRTIVLETETVEKCNKEKWTNLDQSKREELVNEHFIPSEVRVQYTSGFVGGWQRMPRGNAVDNRPLHLSQPTGEEEWKGLLVEGHCTDSTRSEALVTNPDICLSQPLDYSYEPSSSTFTITSRLHKQQRSFRAAAFRATAARNPSLPHQKTARVTPQPSRGASPSLLSCRRLTPCSSPSTVMDDERASLSAPDLEEPRADSPLGFQRTKLRSLSMRPKRGDSSREKSQPAHKSFRGLTTRIKKEVPPKGGVEAADTDDKIDLPDERLMRDHVASSFVRQKPERYSKTRFFKRPAADVNLPLERVRSSNNETSAPAVPSTAVLPVQFTAGPPANYAERSVDITITPTSPTKSLSAVSIGSASTVSRRSSHDSLDVMSMTSLTSSRSHLLDDSHSEHSSQLKPKRMTEGASRLPLSKRCGSAYKTSTSDFADRKTLFKPNMLKIHKSVCSTLSDSREATPMPDPHIHLSCVTPLSQDLLKPPPLLPITKQDSLVESITTDLPSSPDHMSTLSSPPDTPLLCSPEKYNRESGYMSSSFEVLEDDSLSEKVSFAGEHSSLHQVDRASMLAAVDVQ